MFGYIYINRRELSEEARKEYQAYYCGLCQVLKKSSGMKGQMLLNYDMTFLIILLTGLYELQNTEGMFVCPLHPGKKKVAFINEASQYASDMNVLLSYHNLIDDWKDEKNYPKHVISMMLKKDYLRISKKYPRQTMAVENYMRLLDMLEKKREENIDAISGLTGEMLGEIFAWKDDMWAEELHCLGFYMGKFIYLMDAYEDLEKDTKKQEYNPFGELAKKNPKDFDTLSKLILTSMMSECAKSFERMPILLHADIIRNILYSGVWSRYEMIQEKKRKKSGEKSSSTISEKAAVQATVRAAVKAEMVAEKAAQRAEKVAERAAERAERAAERAERAAERATARTERITDHAADRVARTAQKTRETLTKASARMSGIKRPGRKR